MKARGINGVDHVVVSPAVQGHYPTTDCPIPHINNSQFHHFSVLLHVLRDTSFARKQMNAMTSRIFAAIAIDPHLVPSSVRA